MLLVGLAACVQSGGVQRDPEISPHQQPSVTAPGVHVSGHVNVGVVRKF
ncbi:hypothetical protein Z948_886 [Sulfitobacter donghicola DSW-25 = KCTC 12864 = JCM 14565]|nr:hypothetical protein Z948_886 [Sulfitobacter donghicola DSW-25 = KCTC 12864 = JCM 14565]